MCIRDSLNTGGPNPVVLRSLEHNRAVTGIMQGIALTEISVNKVLVGGIAGTAIRGPLLLSAVDGHLPSGDNQIGLGAVSYTHLFTGTTRRFSTSWP